MAARPQPAFAVSQFDSSDKTESYEILRHPGGGRKDVLRWVSPGVWPLAELEIYRAGAEPGQRPNSPREWALEQAPTDHPISGPPV